jgi:T5orf172 domain
MAEAKAALRRRRDGKLCLELTPRRAQALWEALGIALSSDGLDKRQKGVVRAVRELPFSASSGHTLKREARRWVYVAKDVDRNGLTKIGHTINVKRRFARRTDRLTQLQVLAAWRFPSVARAMKHEAAARKKYKAYDGDGGQEWVKADAGKVVADLKRLWGVPDLESRGLSS